MSTDGEENGEIKVTFMSGLLITDIFSSDVWADLVTDRAGGLHYQPFLSASLVF